MAREDSCRSQSKLNHDGRALAATRNYDLASPIITSSVNEEKEIVSNSPVPKSSTNKKKKAPEKFKGGFTASGSSPAPTATTAEVAGGQPPNSVKDAAFDIEDLGTNMNARIGGGQKVRMIARPATINPLSIGGGVGKSNHAADLSGDLTTRVVRAAESNLQSRARVAVESQSGGGHADEVPAIDGATPVLKSSSAIKASTATVSSSPGLYDYQIDRIAAGIAAAEAFYDEQDRLRREATPPATPSPVSIAASPVFCLVPPHDISIHLSSSSQPGAARSGGAPPKRETLEDIRRNMGFLVNDDPISDRSFAFMHYGGCYPFNEDIMGPLAPLKKMSEPLKVNATKEHTIDLFLAQRADSSAHALSKGEKLPGYAYTGPEAKKNLKSANKKPAASEEAVAKATREFGKANCDYDEEFEHHLGNMFD